MSAVDSAYFKSRKVRFTVKVCQNPTRIWEEERQVYGVVRQLAKQYRHIEDADENHLTEIWGKFKRGELYMYRSCII